ncbi:TPA: ead/Ea22-like family protein [Klebsiella quasipneumoniae]
MTDITELAQSEINDALAQLKQISEYPTPSTQYARVLRKYILDLVEALEKAQQRNAELEAQKEYIRKRYQQLDLLIGKNILVMQAAIIEWQATGDAKNGLAWIYNTLFGPGELPDEAEKDAQAYFDRKYAPLDEELMALHKWFWEQSEAERAAAGIKVEAE